VNLRFVEISVVTTTEPDFTATVRKELRKDHPTMKKIFNRGEID